MDFKNLLLAITLLAVFTFYCFSKFLVLDQVSATFNVDAVIVYGFPANDNGTISVIQQTRMDKGIEQFKKRNAKYLITTGGAAYNQFIEAEVMKNYAIANGINASKIYVEGKSNSTIENTRNVLKLISAENLEIKNAVLVSSAFHTHRITNLMKANCEVELVTIAAKYPAVMNFIDLAKALFREMIGWLYHLIFSYKV